MLTAVEFLIFFSSLRNYNCKVIKIIPSYVCFIQQKQKPCIMSQLAFLPAMSSKCFPLAMIKGTTGKRSFTLTQSRRSDK